MGTSETGISGMGSTPAKEGFMKLPITDRQQVVIDNRIADINEIGYLAKAGNTPTRLLWRRTKIKRVI